MGKKASRAIPPPSLFCDASFLIALFAKADQAHSRALKIHYHLKGHSVRLITSWPVVSEAVTLLLYHYGYSTALLLLETLPAFHLMTPLESDYQEAVVLFRQFNRDQKLSLTDLLTHDLINEKLKKIPIVTFDRDFSRMGLTVYR